MTNQLPTQALHRLAVSAKTWRCHYELIGTTATITHPNGAGIAITTQPATHSGGHEYVVRPHGTLAKAHPNATPQIFPTVGELIGTVEAFMRGRRPQTR